MSVTSIMNLKISIGQTMEEMKYQKHNRVANKQAANYLTKLKPYNEHHNQFNNFDGIYCYLLFFVIPIF